MQTNGMIVINPPASGTNLAPGAVKDSFDYDFPSIDINAFLLFYAELIEGRVILRPAQLPAPTFTLTATNLTRKEALQAFDTLLAMNGISVIKIGERFMKLVPSASVFQEGAPFSRQDPEALPDSGQYVVHLIQLKYSKPSELVPVLQPFAKIPNSILPIESSQMIVIRDYAENVKRMLEMIKQIDISVPSEFVSEVIPIKYALASEIASALNSLSSGGGGATVGRAAGRSTSARPTTPGMPGTQQHGGPGTTPAMGTAMGTLGAPGGTPAAGSTSFADRLRGIIQKASASGELQLIGQTKIIADERTNSLLIFAAKQDMEMIKDIISKLDVVLAQVLIEAIILEVGIGDSLNYGVSWLKRPDTSGKFTGSGVIQNSPSFRDPLDLAGDFGGSGTNTLASTFGSGLNWWGKYNKSFDVAVQAAAEDSRVNDLSRPRIQTSHAVPASIQIGVSRPIITGTYSYYSGTPQSQYQYQNFGITLNVTPLINPDGLVVMDIDQTIQSVGRDIKVDANVTMPEVTTRSANAKVAVHNRETVMLGGFISTDLSDSKSGVPILKDIPLLGQLFTSVTKKKNRSELIVLIRPTVLETPEIAAKVATEERNRLPGIRRAEAENEVQERKLLSEELKRAQSAGQLEEQKGPSKEERILFNRPGPMTPAEKKALEAGEAPPR